MNTINSTNVTIMLNDMDKAIAFTKVLVWN